MAPFAWINPCGLQNVGMTSIKRELAHSVSMEDIRTMARMHLENVFHINTRRLKYEKETPDIYSDMVSWIQSQEKDSKTV